MRKINLLSILAIAILVPMLFTSCGNKEELIGNYEVDQKDITKMLGKNAEGADVGIKLSLNKNDSAVFAISTTCEMLTSENDSTSTTMKVSFDVVYNGNWDYSGISKQIKLKMNEGEFKNIKILSDDVEKSFMDENKVKEALMNDLRFKDLNQLFKEKSAINVKEIQEDGFIAEGKENKDEIKFKKVK